MILKGSQKNILIAVAAAFVLLLLIFLLPDHKDSSEFQGPKADVTGYERDCVHDVLSSGIVPIVCTSVDRIKNTYNVDAPDLLNEKVNLMAQTARYIARGEILNEKALKSCIASGSCVDIPLVSASARDNEAQANLPENVKKTEIFWSLVNSGSLTPSICDIMDLCRAMVKAGIVTP